MLSSWLLRCEPWLEASDQTPAVWLLLPSRLLVVLVLQLLVLQMLEVLVVLVLQLLVLQLLVVLVLQGDHMAVGVGMAIEMVVHEIKIGSKPMATDAGSSISSRLPTTTYHH